MRIRFLASTNVPKMVVSELGRFFLALVTSFQRCAEMSSPDVKGTEGCDSAARCFRSLSLGFVIVNSTF